jgi:hypothetical protein
MVDRATSALDVGRIRGQVKRGGDGGGRVKAIVGVANNETIDRFRPTFTATLAVLPPSFLLSEIHCPGAVYYLVYSSEADEDHGMDIDRSPQTYIYKSTVNITLTP